TRRARRCPRPPGSRFRRRRSRFCRPVSLRARSISRSPATAREPSSWKPRAAMCTSAPRRGRGFTLPDLVLLIVVLGMALAGIVTLYMTTVAGSADPMVRKQAIAVAEALMEEALTQALAEPSSATPRGATPETFDSIGDYDGYSESGIKSFSGPPAPGLKTTNLPSTAAPTPFT